MKVGLVPIPEAVRSCVACGLCLPRCPTYREHPAETSSPRGRLALMRGLFAGQIPASTDVVQALDECLGCKACETACPAHLSYGEALEEARSLIRQSRRGRRLVARIEGLILRHALSSGPRLAWMAQRVESVTAPLLRHLPLGPWLGRLRALIGSRPRADGPAGVMPGRDLGPRNETGHEVWLLHGCVADAVLATTTRAARAVLEANGHRVRDLSGPCCGALASHRGLPGAARDLAAEVLDRVAEYPAIPVLSTSAGCGAHLRGLGHLFRDDPRRRDQAARVGAGAIDIHEYLTSRPLAPMGPVERRVAYDAPCHLLHGQGVSAPLSLLGQVPGLELVPLPESDWCCGSAGTYMITQPTMAGKILARKADQVTRLRPQQLLTANPGCLMYLRQGLWGSGIPVSHVMELLAEAYAARPAA